MDEFDLTRRAYPSPPEDPEARDRVLQRLREAIDAEGAELPKRRRGSRVWVAGIAACLALLILITFSVNLIGQPSAAAAELHRLAGLAAQRSAPDIGPGQFILMRSEELRTQEVGYIGPGSTYRTISRLSLQTWIASDGSGYGRVTTDSTSLASAADRAAWEADGKPALGAPGDVETSRYTREDAPWRDTSSLPSDPAQLLAALRADPNISNDAEVYLQIGTLLAEGDSSPSLRSALFEVASQLPSIQLLGTRTDGTGRTGTAIALDAFRDRTELIFDPNTSQLLGMNTYSLLSDGSVGPLLDWRAFEPTQVVDTAPAFAGKNAS
jgi:hypothetical protein